MIIIKVMGGLGNQMQQYALYEKFRAIGRQAKLDISWFEDAAQQEKVLARRDLELRQFESLQFETASPGECAALLGRGGRPGAEAHPGAHGCPGAGAHPGADDRPGAGAYSGISGVFAGAEAVWRKVKRKLNPAADPHFFETDMYHPEIFSFEEKYLEGHWACEKYYHDIMPLLREKIRFPESGNPQNGRVAERMERENSVSLHIRRGDYLDPENAGMFGGICTDAYYAAAMNYVRERMPDAHFYLFSDDTTYLKEHFKGAEYTIVDWNRGADNFFDCELMSHCRANICANSTFSFWGARLNGREDKITIRPAKHKNSQVIDPTRMHALWEDWVLIDEKGSVL